jgi:hypothetical protein
MSSALLPRSRSLVVQAIIGGIVGGIVVDLYLSIALHASLVDLEGRNAALVAAPGASPLLGVIAHFAIAIVWALIYTAAFNALGGLRNWLLGGIVLGIVVDVVMTLAITIKTGAPWGTGVVMGLLPNVVFYALPVALYLAFSSKRVSTAP